MHSIIRLIQFRFRQTIDRSLHSFTYSLHKWSIFIRFSLVCASTVSLYSQEKTSSQFCLPVKFKKNVLAFSQLSSFQVWNSFSHLMLYLISAHNGFRWTLFVHLKLPTTIIAIKTIEMLWANISMDENEVFSALCALSTEHWTLNTFYFGIPSSFLERWHHLKSNKYANKHINRYFILMDLEWRH